MTAPSKGIADILVGEGIGAIGGISGWAIRISRSKDKPNKLITIYDTGGQNSEIEIDIDRPSVQIMVRGGIDGYVEAYGKCEEIRDALQGRPSEIRDGNIWASVVMHGGFNMIGYDENSRPELSLNFQLIIHQGDLSSSFRRSC